MPVRPLESDEQKMLIGWLRAKRIHHHANVNENNTHKQNRKYAMIAEQKAISAGKIKGLPDVTVFLPDRILYIELKRQKKILKSGQLSNADSKPSKEQLKVIEWINLYPYAEAHVAYGAKDAIRIIESLLK